MSSMPNVAESVLRTTARDWGLAPGDPPAAVAARDRRSVPHEPVPRATARRDDRRLHAVPAGRRNDPADSWRGASFDTPLGRADLRDLRRGRAARAERAE
jgi:hypothetical protein